MAQALPHVVALLSSQQAIVNAGFMVGMVDVLATKRTLTHPLSTLLAGAIQGFMCGWGASIVSSYMPKSLYPIIPVLCGIACVHRFVCHKSYPDPTTRNPIMTMNFN